jgi:hypothetical protein
MHRDGRVGHALELAIQSAHAIDKRTRRKQSVAFENTSSRETGCVARNASSG